MATLAAGTVRYARSGALGRLVLDRPPLNVLDLATLEALHDAVREASADRTLKALVLEGAGRAFCAGVDVADHTADRVGRTLALFHGVVKGLLAFDAPVVALVHGATLGGGCELALAADIVLAADDLRIGQPEIRLAVFPPAAAALLPRLAGRSRALDLVLTGRTLGATEAQAMGLVSRVFPAASFAAGAEAVLEDLAALSGPALRLAKRAVTQGLDRPLAAALDGAESLYLDELMHLSDAHEGLAAFLEKRPPAWAEAT